MPALFYHLTRSTEEDLIRMLITRAMANGWRVMLRGTDEGALRRLDARLWAEPKDSFLPHGMQGGTQDADQPVLLGMGAATNQPQGVILTGGAVATADEAKALERLWVLFDGGDEAAVQGARALWRQMTAGGVPAEYWTEDDGKWAKKNG